MGSDWWLSVCMRAVSGKRVSAARAGSTNIDTGSDSSGHSRWTAVCSNTMCLEHSRLLFFSPIPNPTDSSLASSQSAWLISAQILLPESMKNYTATSWKIVFVPHIELMLDWKLEQCMTTKTVFIWHWREGYVEEKLLTFPVCLVSFQIMK